MDKFLRILELEPGASIEQIKAARKELLQVWHPDRFQHHPELAAKALQKTKRIHAMFFDCFFAFRRDLVQRLGILL